MLSWLLSVASRVKQTVEQKRLERRWLHLKAMGMHIGRDVNLPGSTYIDTGHCYLISIGDHCGLGPECLILAHDAQMDEYLDAARIGRVVIHESCHIGARCTILAGVEIGPRTIVGANSVVSHTLPPNTVCAGNPARVICSLDEYLAKHRERLKTCPTFDYMTYDIRFVTPEARQEIVDATRAGHAYMVGGRSAELKGLGSTQRTAAE